MTIRKLSGDDARRYLTGQTVVPAKWMSEAGVAPTDPYDVIHAAFQAKLDEATGKREQERWETRLAEIETMVAKNDGQLITGGYYGDESKGDPPGVFLGGGLAAVGLEAGQTVDNEQLRRLWEGRHPVTGEPLSPNFTPGGKTRIDAYDLGMSVHKDISILAEIGDDETRRTIARVLREADLFALNLMEQEAARVHRGAQGAHQMAAKFIAARFEHTTSRAVEKGLPGDMNWHSHTVLFNVAVGADGKITALVSPELYAWYRNIGPVRTAFIQERLEKELGIRFETPDEKGIAGIIGFDEKVRDLFSKRRKQVEAAALDMEDAESRQRAAEQTRRGKEGGYTRSQRRASYIAQVEEAGLSVSNLLPHLQAAGRVAALRKEMEDTANSAAEGNARLRGSDEDLLFVLTETQATFTRREVIRAMAERARERGIPATRVVAAADAWLEKNEQVVKLGVGIHTADPREGGYTIPTKHAQRYSTVDVIAAERSLLGITQRGVAVGAGVVSHGIVDRVLGEVAASGFQLGEDQEEMIRHLAIDGNRVSVVCAPAGSGKTTALRYYRQVLEAGGYYAIGASTSGKATRELADEALIASDTIAALIGQLDRGQLHLTEKHVLVIDEAGMAGTKNLERLAQACQRANAKLVLVGDPRQLSAVEAGGLFTDIIRDHPEVVSELVENRRQEQEWERQVLAKLRWRDDHGELSAEVAGEVAKTYLERGCVREFRTEQEMAAAMVDAYFADLAATKTDPRTGKERTKTSLMLALHRSTVANLNSIALERARELGLLGKAHEFGGKEWFEGQRVLCAKGRKMQGILNGITGTVKGVKDRGTGWKVTATSGRKTVTWNASTAPTVGARVELGDKTFTVEKVETTEVAKHLIITTDQGVEFAIPEDYAASHLMSGYASTVHKAQGATVDTAHTYPKGFTNNLAYTALSRGREPSTLYVVVEPVQPESEVCGRRHADDEFGRQTLQVEEQLLAVFMRDGDEETALTHQARRAEGDLNWLALEARRAELAAILAESPPSSAVLRHGLAQDLEEARLVGDDYMVKAIEERIAQLTPHDGYTPEEDIVRAAWLEEHADVVDEWKKVSGDLDRTQRALIAYATRKDNSYLPEVPEAITERGAWRRQVAAIESYRVRWGIDPKTLTRDNPLGVEPRTEDQRQEWLAAHQVLAESRGRSLDYEALIESEPDISPAA